MQPSDHISIAAEYLIPLALNHERVNEGLTVDPTEPQGNGRIWIEYMYTRFDVRHKRTQNL